MSFVTSSKICFDNFQEIDVLNVALVEKEILVTQNGTLKIIEQERGINNETHELA